jgi:hypothetical protein
MVGTPASTTTNSEQETVIQETDIVVDVAQALENFGIAKSAATKLMQRYPAQYIREKLAMAQGLVADRSQLVSQNPAGWLRRAIEENYSSPRSYERHWQRSLREKKHAKLVQADPRKQHMLQEESQRAQSVPTESEQTVATTYGEQPQNVPTAQREPANRDSTTPEEKKANEATWEKVVTQVTRDLPQEEVTARLAGTALVAVTDTVARIGGTNPSALVWLERRLYRQIAKALKGVLGKELDLQFVATS